MLVLNSQIIGKLVQSIHTGSSIGQLKHAIVDYNDLKIIAYDIEGPLAKQEGLDILMTNDIREYAPVGAIVDSIDSLADGNDVVAVKQIRDVQFDPLHLKVKTQKGKKLGQVTDFILDTQDFLIQQLIIRRPAMQALLDPELTISRDKIVEVTDYYIVIKDDVERPPARVEKKQQSAEFVPNYVNPFKKPELAPETESVTKD